MNEQDELNILFPVNEMEVGGEKLNLRPFLFGKWPEVINKAAGIINIVLDAIREGGEAVLDVSLEPEDFRVAPEAFDLFLRLISEGGDNLYDILAISARKPRDWVDELEAEDGIKLLAGTFAVNKDFFTKRVAPMFPKKLKENLTEISPEILPGEKSSKH